MAIQKGIGVVWGIGTTDLAAGTGVLRLTGENYSRDKEFVEHRGTDGEHVGVTSFGGTTTLELDVYPASDTASPTLAEAVNANINLPTVGATVTLTDSADTDIAGDWLCVAVGKRKTNTDKTVATVSLKRWTGISSYTTVS